MAASTQSNGAKPAPKTTSVLEKKLPLWACVAVAILSVALGLYTPPLFNKPASAQKASETAPSPSQEEETVSLSDVETELDSPPVKEEEERNLQEADQESAEAVADEPSVQNEETQQIPEPLYPCEADFLKDYWHDERVVGFHIACIKPANERSVQLTLYPSGLGSELVPDQMAADWEVLKREIERLLRLPNPNEPGFNFQPWALFSPEGRRLADGSLQDTYDGRIVDVLLDNGVFLVYQGGQFLWPGVRVGFERRNVPLYSVMPEGLPEQADSNHTATITTLSLSPLVVQIKGFLSDDECTQIQEAASPTIRYSQVVLMDQDAGRPASDFRTSQSTFIDSRGKPTFLDIDNRVASLTRIPRSHQEYVQVLRYGVTEKYDHHHDYFDPAFYQNDPATLRSIRNGRKNRLATVFWYLSTVEEGGETAFPHAFGGHPEDARDCTTGLLVKPERGNVIIFYSLLMSGQTDKMSLHGACPVKRGTKWAANKWVWNEPSGYVA